MPTISEQYVAVATAYYGPGYRDQAEQFCREQYAADIEEETMFLVGLFARAK